MGLFDTIRQWLSPSPPPPAYPDNLDLPHPGPPPQSGMQTMGRIWIHHEDGTWSLETGNNLDPIMGLSGAPDGTVFATGWDNAKVQVYTPGQGWHREETGSRRLGAVLANAAGVWALGNKIWRRQPDGTWRAERHPSLWTRSIWAAAPDDLFVSCQGAVLRSRGDGHWRQELVPDDANLSAIAGLRPDAVFAFSEDGRVFRSAGRGDWTLEHTAANRFCGAWAVGGRVFGVGVGGQIVSSTGDGQWSTEDSGTNAQLLGTWGRSLDEVYAFGLNGTFLVRNPDATWSARRGPYRGGITAMWGPPTGRTLFISGDEFMEVP